MLAVFILMPPAACKRDLPFESDGPSANSPTKMSTSRYSVPTGRVAGETGRVDRPPITPRVIEPPASERQLLRAQAVQHLRRGEAVRDQAGAPLELADRGAGLGSEPPVLLAHVEAVQRQPLLQLVALREAEHALVARPWLHQRPLAAQAVGEMADGERIGLRGVVAHDHPEIAEHQERRAAGAGRHQQVGAVRRARKCLAADPVDAESLPLLHHELARAVREQVIEPRRHPDLVAPDLAGDPAVRAQIVRGDRKSTRLNSSHEWISYAVF